MKPLWKLWTLMYCVFRSSPQTFTGRWVEEWGFPASSSLLVEEGKRWWTNGFQFPHSHHWWVVGKGHLTRRVTIGSVQISPFYSKASVCSLLPTEFCESVHQFLIWTGKAWNQFPVSDICWVWKAFHCSLGQRRFLYLSSSVCVWTCCMWEREI